jgi:putative lipoprotein (rSAM/lipoprotein system)
MKAKLTDKKRKILRKIYGALSLTSALFIFQACYGTPEDMGIDVQIQGSVKSAKTNQPIPGIKVSIGNHLQYDTTDNTGKFNIYTTRDTIYKVKFEDIDSEKNGAFLSKDTVLKTLEESIFLNVSLDAQ